MLNIQNHYASLTDGDIANTKAEENIRPGFISVIIAALNSSNTIHHTLSSIFMDDFPKNSYEVIVVDNGSKDNTVKIAEEFPTKVFICQKKGQSFARNMGIKNSCGEIIAFTDSDVIVQHNWLKKISTFFEEHPEVDGIGGIVLPPPSGYKNSVQKWVGEIFCEDEVFPQSLFIPKLYSYRGTLFSANCAYRKKTLLLTNGFNESIWDGNDIDLTWNLLKKEKNLVFNPDIQIIHIGFASTIRDAAKKQFKYGRIYVHLMRAHGRLYNIKEFLKIIIISLLTLAKEIVALFSSGTSVKAKQLLKIYLHLAFNVGRLFELLHPFKTSKDGSA
jgi:glycosyltransferase involved in cell wall biosynthesis